MKEIKDFGNKNSNPTTMAQVEAQCLPYWPSMGVKKMKSKKGNPNYYNIRFLCANRQEGHPRDSQGWFTIFLER
jgi:hypothetical protein